MATNDFCDERLELLFDKICKCSCCKDTGVIPEKHYHGVFLKKEKCDCKCKDSLTTK